MEGGMPEKRTFAKGAAKDKREGKSASTQAGEFVREEMHHIHEGKHGASSTKQAIAIGLSKARQAGVKLPAQKSRAKSHSEIIINEPALFTARGLVGGGVPYSGSGLIRFRRGIPPRRASANVFRERRFPLDNRASRYCSDGADAFATRVMLADAAERSPRYPILHLA